MPVYYNEIPKELYFEIRNFLLVTEFWKFLNTSKKLFRTIKQETIKFYISSDLYVNDNDESIRGKVSKFRNFLCLSNAYQTPTKIPPKFLYIDYLELNRLMEWDVVASERFYNNSFIDLKKDGFERIMKITIKYFQKLTNVESLSHLQELEFINCPNLEDVNCLKNAKKLTFRYCHKIVDVSELGNVYDLTLFHCQGITDISNLTKNSFLSLIRCENIKNYSHVRNIPHLTVDNYSVDTYSHTIQYETSRSFTFHNYHDTRCYLNPKHLQSCSFIHSNISNFQNALSCESLMKVSLVNCYSIKSLVGLSMVKVLVLEGCSQLDDLSGLHSVPSGKERRLMNVTVTLCPKVLSFSPLNGIHTVKIQKCTGFKDLLLLKDVKRVTLTSLNSSFIKEIIKEIDIPSPYEFLEIMNCEKLERITGLWKVQELKLIHLPKLHPSTELESPFSGEENRLRKIVLSKDCLEAMEKNALTRSYLGDCFQLAGKEIELMNFVGYTIDTIPIHITSFLKNPLGGRVNRGGGSWYLSLRRAWRKIQLSPVLSASLLILVVSMIMRSMSTFNRIEKEKSSW